MRAVQAGVIGLLFLAFGLWIGGATGRVHALVRAAASSPRVEPIAGSRLSPGHEVVLDGQPARVRRCVAPGGWTIVGVRDHYLELAHREGRLEGPSTPKAAELPLAVVDEPHGAYVLWTSIDGHRKGAIVQEVAGQVEYTLLDADPLPAESSQPGTVVLPGGARAPHGSRPGLAIQDGDSSFTFFEVKGPPADVAIELAASMTSAGFEVEADLAPEGAAASHRVVLPFKGRDRKGFIVAAPTGRGDTRATVVVR